MSSEQMVQLLEAYGVQFTIDFEIVRGLEYYSGTVFEIYAEGLGAQRQICGGGTYELASLFGGAAVSSTGFGLGFDRIMEIVDHRREAGCAGIPGLHARCEDRGGKDRRAVAPEPAAGPGRHGPGPGGASSKQQRAQARSSQ